MQSRLYKLWHTTRGCSTQMVTPRIFLLNWQCWNIQLFSINFPLKSPYPDINGLPMTESTRLPREAMLPFRPSKVVNLGADHQSAFFHQDIEIEPRFGIYIKPIILYVCAKIVANYCSTWCGYYTDLYSVQLHIMCIYPLLHGTIQHNPTQSNNILFHSQKLLTVQNVLSPALDATSDGPEKGTPWIRQRRSSPGVAKAPQPSRPSRCTHCTDATGK